MGLLHPDSGKRQRQDVRDGLRTTQSCQDCQEICRVPVLVAHFPPRGLALLKISHFMRLPKIFRAWVGGGHPVGVHRITIKISRCGSGLSEPWHLQTVQYFQGEEAWSFQDFLYVFCVV